MSRFKTESIRGKSDDPKIFMAQLAELPIKSIVVVAFVEPTKEGLIQAVVGGSNISTQQICHAATLIQAQALNDVTSGYKHSVYGPEDLIK